MGCRGPESEPEVASRDVGRFLLKDKQTWHFVRMRGQHGQFICDLLLTADRGMLVMGLG
jgi:hypothetical protein